MVIGGYTWLLVVIHGYSRYTGGYRLLYMVIDGYWWL